MLALLLWTAASLAADPPPQFGRYRPLYPGLYGQLAYGQDERDSSYDSQGRKQDTAAPQTPGFTSFPEQSVTATFTWHFPMFESYQIPFFSSRTHLARLTLRHARSHTRGALANFITDTSDDADTDADDLRNSGSGVGDPSFEFGSFLLGSNSPDWRSGKHPRYSLLALIGMTLPGGVYDRDAPVSAGHNTVAIHANLGGHWQPWSGGFLDAGYTEIKYFQNYDAAFGANDPSQQGNDHILDLSLAQRLPYGFYLTAFGRDRRGDSNRYDRPRFAPNRPEPPMTTPRSNNYPTPGRYQDEGTALRELGLSLNWFATQKILLGLHYTMPESGKSGQFLLPYINRQPASCTPGGVGCMTTPGDTVLVDGMGSARSFASAHWLLSLSYNFGQGDPYTCPGCQRP